MDKETNPFRRRAGMPPVSTETPLPEAFHHPSLQAQSSQAQLSFERDIDAAQIFSEQPLYAKTTNNSEYDRAHSQLEQSGPEEEYDEDNCLLDPTLVLDTSNHVTEEVKPHEIPECIPNRLGYSCVYQAADYEKAQQGVRKAIGHARVLLKSSFPAPPRPADQLDSIEITHLNDAVNYILDVKMRYQPEIYYKFLRLLESCKHESITAEHAVYVDTEVAKLFVGAPDLLEGYRRFRPTGKYSSSSRKTSLSNDTDSIYGPAPYHGVQSQASSSQESLMPRDHSGIKMSRLTRPLPREDWEDQPPCVPTSAPWELEQTKATTGTADHESQEPRRQGARPAEVDDPNDLTEDEDWAAVGAAALRQGAVPNMAVKTTESTFGPRKMSRRIYSSGPKTISPRIYSSRQAAAPSMAHYSDLPSEEEQLRLLSENDESGWNEDQGNTQGLHHDHKVDPSRLVENESAPISRDIPDRTDSAERGIPRLALVGDKPSWREKEAARAVDLSYEVHRDEAQFNHAIEFVNEVKKHFGDQPQMFREFLSLLQSYKSRDISIRTVYIDLLKLFADAPQLLENFNKHFAPSHEELENEKQEWHPRDHSGIKTSRLSAPLPREPWEDQLPDDEEQEFHPRDHSGIKTSRLSAPLSRESWEDEAKTFHAGKDTISESEIADLREKFIKLKARQEGLLKSFGIITTCTSEPWDSNQTVKCEWESTQTVPQLDNEVQEFNPRDHSGIKTSRLSAPLPRESWEDEVVCTSTNPPWDSTPTGLWRDPKEYLRDPSPIRTYRVSGPLPRLPRQSKSWGVERACISPSEPRGSTQTVLPTSEPSAHELTEESEESEEENKEESDEERDSDWEHLGDNFANSGLADGTGEDWEELDSSFEFVEAEELQI